MYSVALHFFLVNFLCVSFSNAVICEDYVALQMNGVWSILWNATDRGRLKYLDKFDIQRTMLHDIFL